MALAQEAQEVNMACTKPNDLYIPDGLLDTPSQERKRVIYEAIRWLGTPYAHAARTLGVGVDCGQLIRAVYTACGVEDVEVATYPPDWMLHREESRFMALLTMRMMRADTPLPGDCALYRYGRCACHAAILTGSGYLIHAWRNAGHVEVREQNMLADRLDSYWRPITWAE